MREQGGHGRVQLDQGDAFDALVFQDFAHGHAVATAQHSYFFGSALRRHGGVHQRFVITVFVALGKLQVAVEEQAVPLLAFAGRVGDDDALVRRTLRKDDAVGVELVFGQRGDLPGPRQARGQQRHRQAAGDGVGGPLAQLVPEQPQRPHRHQRVQQAEQQAGADQPQLRHQDQGKSQRHGQRAQIVEGEHLRHQLFQLHVASQDAHDERDLQPDQRADQQHQPVQQQAEGAGHVGVGQKQQRRQQAAGQRHQQFDAQEVRRQLALEKARQIAADAHGKQVAADDGAELQHRIAQHVAGDGTGRQLVQQAAGGDDEDAGQQRDFDRMGAARGGGGVGRIGGERRRGGQDGATLEHRRHHADRVLHQPAAKRPAARRVQRHALRHRHVAQLPLANGGAGGRIVDDQVVLEVELKAAPVHVGRADQRDLAVGGDRLGVQQAQRVFVDLHAGLQQGRVGAVARGADQLGVVARGQHQHGAHAAPGRRAQGAQQRLVGHEVRRGDDQLMPRRVQRGDEHVGHGVAGRGRPGAKHLRHHAGREHLGRGRGADQRFNLLAGLGDPGAQKQVLRLPHHRAFAAQQDVDPGRKARRHA